MIITYHGEAFIKIQQGDSVIALNPISKDSGQRVTRFGSNLALVSYQQPAYQGIDQVTLGDKVPFVIDGPGEYEAEGISVEGFGLAGPGADINTIYRLIVDGMSLVHWGILSEAKITEEIMSEIAEVDVLFGTLGDKDLINPASAAKLAMTFSPKLIVPLTESEAIRDKFLKELGAEKVPPLDKLVLKKKDVVDKEGEVIVLNAV